jgi:hypothetical protein
LSKPSEFGFVLLDPSEQFATELFLDEFLGSMASRFDCLTCEVNQRATSGSHNVEHTGGNNLGSSAIFAN